MSTEKTISDLTECYRLIGAAQAKKGLGIFTQEDSRFLSAMYEAGLRHEKTLSEEIAKRDARIKELEERRCEICGYAEHHREHTGCLRVLVKEQSERIAELEQDLQTTTDALGHVINQPEECYPGIAHDFEQAKLTLTQQADEIDRLKGVVAKCKWALENCGQGQGSDDTDDGTFCRIDLVEESLAAIKEEGL